MGQRVPILMNIPAYKHDVFVAPMIDAINPEPLMSEHHIDCIYLGGEYCAGEPRPCDYEWVKTVRDSCVKHDTTFYWRNTGTYLIKNGNTFRIEAVKEQSRLAMSMKLDVILEDIRKKPAPRQARLF